MVLEQDVDAMTLGLSPFVLRHHQRMLTAGEYLPHGLAVGVCCRRRGLVAIVFLGDETAAYVDADIVNGLIIDLLYMKTVIDHMGVMEYLT